MSYFILPTDIRFLSIGCSAIAFVMLLRTTENFRIHFAPEHATIGQVVEALFPTQVDELHTGGGNWSREQVRLALRKIIVEQLGVSPDFPDDANFVEDLGAD